MKNMKIMNPLIWLIVCLTLGLAPYLPEPHIVEKFKWIVSDIGQLALIDWFDVILHGFPWVMLILSIIVKLKSKTD